MTRVPPREPVPDSYRFRRIELRPAERQLMLDGEPAKIGARAFDVLLTLAERHDRLVGMPPEGTGAVPRPEGRHRVEALCKRETT